MEPAPRISSRPGQVELRVPFSTLFKLTAFAALLASVWMLRSFLAALSLALVSAVTLVPVVKALRKRGLGHGKSVLVVALGLLVVVGVFWALVLPPLASQISDLVGHAASLKAGLDARAARVPVLQRLLHEAYAWPNSPEAKNFFKQKWSWGLALFDGFAGLVLLYILTVYLLLDGKRIYAWILSYVPRRHRDRVAATIPEVNRVVRAYVRGQIITSVICGAYAWVGLALLHVPAALPLAVLAGILDVLPVLGFIIAVVPAALVGMTRSPATGLAVLALYVVYHAIENYVLIPKIYGNELRLSTLSVLVAIVIGGTLGGVLGAVLVLPVVAAYSIVERLWLGAYVGDEAIQDHAALDHPDDDVAAVAVSKVIEGALPPGSDHPDRPRH